MSRLWKFTVPLFQCKSSQWNIFEGLSFIKCPVLDSLSHLKLLAALSTKSLKAAKLGSGTSGITSPLRLLNPEKKNVDTRDFFLIYFWFFSPASYTGSRFLLCRSESVRIKLYSASLVSGSVRKWGWQSPRDAHIKRSVHSAFRGWSRVTGTLPLERGVTWNFLNVILWHCENLKWNSLHLHRTGVEAKNVRHRRLKLWHSLHIKTRYFCVIMVSFLLVLNTKSSHFNKELFLW